MYFADSHMHSIVSRDSESPRADMARGAVAHGVSEICFTDHFDILDIDGSYNPNYDWAPAREQQQLALAACGATVLATMIARRRGWVEMLMAGLTAAFVLLAFAANQNEPFAGMQSYSLLYGPDGVDHPIRWVMLAATIVALGMMALTPYLSIGHRPLAAVAVFIFALGFATRLVMGFSPTVVESGERTLLPFYGAMMLAALLCLRDVKAEGGRRKSIAAAFILCAILAGANVLSSFALAA